MKRHRLAILATHPVQYFVPVFRGLACLPDLRVRVFLGCRHGESESSIDPDFGLKFAWDCDLSSGYERVVITKAPLNRLSGFSGAFAGLLAALRILAWRPNTALIYAYSPSFIATASLIMLIARVPIVLRADTSDEAYCRSPLKSWFRDSILRQYYKFCYAILPIGAESYRHYLRLGVSPSRLHTVPYAVDKNIITPITSSTIQTHQKLRLGFVGKFTPVKDPLIIPRAIAHLSSKERDHLALSTAGDGPLTQQFMAEIKEMLTSVSMKGFVNQSQLVGFYKDIDVLILPSVQGEVWGLVVNEALSQGIRVIVSDRVSCRHDLVLSDQHGWIFSAGQSRSLARAIRLAMHSWPWPRSPHPTPSTDDLVRVVREVIQ